MLSQHQEILEKQLQSLGLNIDEKTDATPIQAYRVHLISQMQRIKELTGYQSWSKEDIPLQSGKEREKFSIKVGEGLKTILTAIFVNNIESYIKKEVHNSALEEIQLLFSQKMEYIISKFTTEEAGFYERVVHFYAANKQSTYFVDKSKAPALTIYYLVRLDVFSLVLWQNEEFYLSSQNYKIKDIFPKTIIMKVFDLAQNQLEHFKIMFRQMRQFICFDYLNQFRDILAIFCFIELKYKISTYYMANNKQKRLVKDSQVILLKGADTREVKRSVKFNFCQLALMHAYIWPILKVNMMLQSKVITSIFSIPKDIDARSLKEELLTIKIRLNISMRQVFCVYDSVQDNQTIEELKSQFQWIVNIYQWKYITQHRSPSQITDILESEKCRNCWMVGNYFLNKIQTRYAIKRFQLTATIAEAIKKTMRVFPGHEEVFIHYFTYPFKGKDNKAPKVFVSLILATKGDSIFFEALFPFKLSQHQFLQFLMRFFGDLYEKTKKSYEINLYSFNYKYSFPDEPLFKLINFIKKTSNSFVLPLNSSVYFKKHFVINKAIQMRLYFLSSLITQGNFYGIIKMILLQMKKQKPDNKFHDRANMKNELIQKKCLM